MQYSLGLYLKINVDSDLSKSLIQVRHWPISAKPGTAKAVTSARNTCINFSDSTSLIVLTPSYWRRPYLTKSWCLLSIHATPSAPFRNPANVAVTLDSWRQRAFHFGLQITPR